jgi:hypothetical protein
MPDYRWVKDQSLTISIDFTVSSRGIIPFLKVVGTTFKDDLNCKDTYQTVLFSDGTVVVFEKTRAKGGRSRFAARLVHRGRSPDFDIEERGDHDSDVVTIKGDFDWFCLMEQGILLDFGVE